MRTTFFILTKDSIHASSLVASFCSYDGIRVGIPFVADPFPLWSGLAAVTAVVAWLLVRSVSLQAHE